MPNFVGLSKNAFQRPQYPYVLNPDCWEAQGLVYWVPLDTGPNGVSDLTVGGGAGRIRLPAGSWDLPMFGPCLRFTGVNSLVTVNNARPLQLGSTPGAFPFTISAWIYLERLGGGGTETVFASGSTAMTTDSNNRFSFSRAFSGTLKTVVANQAVVVNKLVHYVTTDDGTATAATTHMYINGLEPPYVTQTDGVTTLSAVTPVQIGSGGTTNPLFGSVVDFRIYNYQMSQAQVQNLMTLTPQWNLYRPQVTQKRYAFFGDGPFGPVSDTQPLAAQPPRPKYIRLNTFSPQAQGLYAWMPVIDGTFVQTNTPGFSRLNGSSILTNVPNQVLQRSRATQNNPGPDATLGVPPTAPSDFGTAALSFQNIDSLGKRQLLYFQANVDLSGQSTLTFVYWIFPFQSNVTETGYWLTNDTENVSTNTGVTFSTTQTLSFATDPHIPGRWQMMTVARSLSQITVWRDQTLIGTVSAAGSAIAAQQFYPEFMIARGKNTTDNDAQGVNAIWADFRIYSREWTQNDVNYAYNPATRWDYYYKPKTTPYEDIPIGPPPSSGFLSRLALMGAG